tara:strand:+ start:409 stop:1821 length:1413 start_codon:yes stop_codon:yes gene_type:complete
MEASKFPKDLLPNVLDKIVKELNEEVNYPIEFTTMSMLYAFSVAIGNTYKVKRRNSYKVNLSLNLCIVAPSSSCKSHPLDWCLEPLYEQDNMHEMKYNQALKQYLAYEKKSDKDKELCEEVAEPILKQIIMQDATPEAFVQSLYENPRGLGSHNDEVLEYFNNFNRYNSGGARQQKIRILDGKPIKVNRKGFRHNIASTWEAVAGTIQNEVFHEISVGPRSRDGLLYRFIIIMPSGLKKIDIPIDEEEESFDHLLEKWKVVIKEALNFRLNLDDFKAPSHSLLPYAKESRKKLQEWEMQNTEKANLAPISSHLRTIYGKLEITFHKLCGLFQLLEHVCEKSSKEEIQINAVMRTIMLIEYIEETHVALAMENIREDLEKEIGTDYLKQVYSRLPEKFGHSDAYNLYYEIEAQEESLDLAPKKERDKALMRAKKNTQNWLKKKINGPKKYKLFTKDKHGIYVKLFLNYKYK